MPGKIILLGFIALLCLTCSAMSPYQDNVVIVLDASGSMDNSMTGGRKIDVAKEALIQVVSTVPDSTNIGLLVFSASNCKDWVYDLGPLDRNKINQAIMLPKPYGGTPLGDYLKKGADRLLKQREEQNGYGTYRLLVVTDGKASDPEVVEKYLPDVLSRGITIDVIGVAMKDTHVLANKAHTYRTADNPETLKSAIKQVFAEISSSDSGFSMEEAFAEIAPLPDDLARSMIQALSLSGNDPIGAMKTASHNNSQPQKNSGKTGKKSEGSILVPFFFLILVIIISKLSSGNKG